MRGIDEVAGSVIEQLQGTEAVYVTLDIDAFDQAFAPGTGTTEAGGLSTRQVLELLRTVFSDLPVRRSTSWRSRLHSITPTSRPWLPSR